MSNQVKGAILTVSGGICWGASGSVGQYLFTRQCMDSRWLVPVRLSCAGILMLIWCLIKYGRKTFSPWKTMRDACGLLVYGIAGVGCCQFFYFLTIQLSSAAVGTILQDLSPIMIVMCECIAARRAPSWKEAVAVPLALFGVFLITTHGTFSKTTVPPAALLTGVLCACAVTVYNVGPVRLLSRFPVFILQMWAFLLGGAVSSFVFQPWHYGYIPNIYGYIGIAFVVIVGNVIAFTSYMTGVSLIGPEKSILYGFSEPVSAAIIAVICLGSTFTVFDALGFAAVFAMMALISYRNGAR